MMKLRPWRCDDALWGKIMRRAKKEGISAAELVRRTMTREVGA